MSRPVMAQGAAHLPRFGTPLGPWGGTEPGGGPLPPEAKLGSGSVGPSVGEKSRGVGEASHFAGRKAARRTRCLKLEPGEPQPGPLGRRLPVRQAGLHGCAWLCMAVQGRAGTLNRPTTSMHPQALSTGLAGLGLVQELVRWGGETWNLEEGLAEGAV